MSPDLARHRDDITVGTSTSIAEALASLDRAGTGALVLCSPERRLVGLLTDGDIRRAVLRGVSMDDPCSAAANSSPIVAQGPISDSEALSLMTTHDINHLPVIDQQGRLQGLLLRTELVAALGLEETALRKLEKVVVTPEVSMADAIAHLDRAGTGALAVCTSDGELLGLLTDGDLRRAILKGISLDQSCKTVANQDPITVRGHPSATEALRIMTQHDINHLPVVDDKGHLVEFLLRRDLVPEGRPSLSAVIMAGGFGKRLLPLTRTVPKPMLPIGGRPLLERTIEQLRRSGIQEVHLTTHYLPESITNHFGDGQAFGVKISYSREDQPLGTAGGLKLVDRPTGPFVVINGDVLTGVSFEEMLHFHRANRAEITVGIRKHEVTVPFGIVECEDVRVVGLREKPSMSFFINAGVYVVEPSACDYIPDAKRFDMTDLIKKMLETGRRVVSFPIMEYWQDVGRLEDYRQAQDDHRNDRI